ncbi:hypothetical protein PoB_004389700 [Plakobranchus ocellatus]|uniref:Uncharacterized protein n=1 Tax=Plakobranchus ocellatus TaxID=259542 RepID=A0AAV4BD56_9GAST|nr:hypothetical protein PoB_004389700 [Plakobranchus ocellatus]
MSPLCKRLRKATVLRELIRGCRNGENVEFEERMQIEDDVVDVFNIPVVGDSAVVDVPDGESAGVYVPDGESPSEDNRLLPATQTTSPGCDYIHSRPRRTAFGTNTLSVVTNAAAIQQIPYMGSSYRKRGPPRRNSISSGSLVYNSRYGRPTTHPVCFN